MKVGKKKVMLKIVRFSNFDNTLQCLCSTGYLLCKSCGADNSILNLVINNRISEQAVSVQNFTLSGKTIVVQELTNPLGISFKVIITKKANCLRTIGGWYPGKLNFPKLAVKFLYRASLFSGLTRRKLVQ